MPELPEVETIVRHLSARLAGQTIKKIAVINAAVVRQGAVSFIDGLHQQTIASVGRHGKSILMTLSNKKILHVHLRMTGQLVFEADAKPTTKHTHVVFQFLTPGLFLHYRDVRKFGGLEVLSDDRRLRKSPDAWTSTDEQLVAILRKKKGMVKHALLDQRVLAGIGNIYADESLYRANIHPRRRLENLKTPKIVELCGSIRAVLAESIGVGGTSFRNYVDTLGSRGGFKERLKVYGKQGTACSVCGQTIKRIVVAGRGTHICPSCQKPPH